MVDGYLGTVDRRKQALERAVRLLRVSVPDDAELVLLKAKHQCVGQDIAVRLTQLHAQLEQYERATDRIQEAIAAIDERSPPVTITPDPMSVPHSTLEDVKAELVRDLREEESAWLRLRGEAQEGIAEQLAEYAQLVAKVGVALQANLPCPDLSELLEFLDQPRPTLEVIPFEIEEVQHSLRRLP